MKDQLALTGYSILTLFALFTLSFTHKNPVDLAANVLLITGLGALTRYHYVKLARGTDELKDNAQRTTRLVAHTSLTAFFLLTLLHWADSIFRWYDGFALASHIYLTYAVYAKASQLLGVAGLFFYFLFVSFYNAKKSGVALLQFAGRVILLVYFAIALWTGLATIRA